MKLNITRISENRRLVCGTVTAVNPSPSGDSVLVKLEGMVWNKDDEVEYPDVLEILFWNGKNRQMADRIKAAKVEPGKQISVDILEENGKVIGNDFKYDGHWIIPATATAREKNVFHGPVSSLQVDEDGRYVKVSMLDGKDENGNTKWATISFWNSETSNLADRAKKCLGKRFVKDENGADVERCPKAIITCRPKSTHNDREWYSAYNFDLIN